MGQVCDRNRAKRCTARMLPAPYPSLTLGPCIFLACFLLPWSPQKQVLQPPAQLRQPHCLGSTPSGKGMLSTLRAGHRAGALPWSISSAACALWHLLPYLHQKVADLCCQLPGGGLRRGGATAAAGSQPAGVGKPCKGNSSSSGEQSTLKPPLFRAPA